MWYVPLYPFFNFIKLTFKQKHETFLLEWPKHDFRSGHCGFTLEMDTPQPKATTKASLFFFFFFLVKLHNDAFNWEIPTKSAC